MADSFIQLATDSTGKKVDTRTEGSNSEHRQVMVIGDPATNAGVAPVDATNGLAVDVKQSALPSGAATSAKQDTGNTALAAIQTATEATQAAVETTLDVNIASGNITGFATSAKQDTQTTSLQLIDDVILADDADFTATTTPAVPVQGVYESTPTTVTDGDLGVVGITAGRRLKTSSTIDAALPAGTNAIGKLAANSGVDIGDVDITSIAAGNNNIGDVDIATIAAGDNNIGNVDIVTMPNVTNGGTFAVQVDGNALTSLQLIDDVVATDDTSTHATGTTKGAVIMAAATPTDSAVNANDLGAVAMTTDRKLHVAVMDALPAGTAAIGKLAANSGVDIGDVDITSIAAGNNNIGDVDVASIAAGNNNIGDVDVASIAAGTNLIGDVGIQPRTSNGLLIGNFTSGDTFTALTNSAQVVKGSAGQIYGWYIYNPNSSVAYVNIYNIAAASVTVGTSTPAINLAIPATSAANVMTEIGIAFGTAISISATTTGGGNTAPSTALEAMIFYK